LRSVSKRLGECLDTLMAVLKADTLILPDLDDAGDLAFELEDRGFAVRHVSEELSGDEARVGFWPKPAIQESVVDDFLKAGVDHILIDAIAPAAAIDRLERVGFTSSPLAGFMSVTDSCGPWRLLSRGVAAGLPWADIADVTRNNLARIDFLRSVAPALGSLLVVGNTPDDLAVAQGLAHFVPAQPILFASGVTALAVAASGAGRPRLSARSVPIPGGLVQLGRMGFGTIVETEHPANVKWVEDNMAIRLLSPGGYSLRFERALPDKAGMRVGKHTLRVRRVSSSLDGEMAKLIESPPPVPHVVTAFAQDSTSARRRRRRRR